MAKIIIVVLGLIILILFIGFLVFKPEQEAKKGGISLEEKQLIETWILENDLNQYGDPKDTVYAGGTPLFDEKTGKTIDKYDYILRRHPDKPWLK